MMRFLRRRILLLSLLATASASFLESPESLASVVPFRFDAKSPERIRVRLSESMAKVMVRGYDLQIFEKAAIKGSDRRLAASPERKTEWEIRCSQGKVRALPLRYDVSKPGKVPVPMILHSPVAVETPAGFLTFNNKPYRESLTVFAHGSSCEVVNEVDIEKYLDGLVNAEFSSKWSEEAIAAQVIAARTYAMYQIRQARLKPESHYDLDATVKDQVYDGSIKEDVRSSRTVGKTRGIVLTSAGGKPLEPIKAFYHSSCGGVTELPENVWGSQFSGFKHSVRCPYCSGAPKSHWELEISGSDVADAVLRGARSFGALLPGWPKDALKVMTGGKLSELRSGSLNPQSRLQNVIATYAIPKDTDSRQTRTVELSIPATVFRGWVGVSRLKSTAFQVVAHRSAQGVQWHFDGRGNGHGVGLCQWGAKRMGEKGFSMASILKFYYPDAKLEKIWN